MAKSPNEWDNLYRHKLTPWESSGVSSIVKEFIEEYSSGINLLEIGCGTGNDAIDLSKFGLKVTAVDIANECIHEKHKENTCENPTFICSDIGSWEPNHLFDIIYEKGFFHNLKGPRKREEFIIKASRMLEHNGLWISVSGSADQYDQNNPHGAILLRDIIEIAEIYFEVIEVKKDWYGLLNSDKDFKSWYCLFRRR